MKLLQHIRYQCGCCGRYFRVGKTGRFRRHYLQTDDGPVPCAGVGTKADPERVHPNDLGRLPTLGRSPQ